MAGYNEILEGRFNRSLQRLFNMKGPASMNELSTSLQYQLSAHADADQRYNESWDSFGFFGTALSNAATGGALRLRNPAASGVIAVFSSILLTLAGGAAADLFAAEIGFNTGDLAGASLIGHGLDSRTVRNSAFVGTINPAAGSGGGAGFGAFSQFPTAAGQTTFGVADFLDGFHRIVLTPGWAVQVRSSTINQTFSARFLWEERPIGDSEGK
jgi:hypothetical protein